MKLRFICRTKRPDVLSSSMARLRRLGAAILVVIGAFLIAPVHAYAGCAADPTAPGCLPTPAPGTAPPKKTPAPTPAPTAAPTKAPAPAPVVHHTTTVSTPLVTPFPVEVDTTAA